MTDWSDYEQEDVASAVRWHKYDRLAKKLGIPRTEAREFAAWYREKHDIKRESGPIRTLPQLLRHAQLDEEAWSIDHADIKYRETASGPLHTVTAKVRPKSLEFHPVRITIEAPRPTPKPKPADEQVWVVLPDAQIGFYYDEPMHCLEMWDIAYQIISEFDDPNVVILGDTLDATTWGQYQTKPGHQNQFQRTLNTAADLLGGIRARTAGRIEMIDGNHDDRIRKKILKDVPQIFDVIAPGQNRPLVSMENLLGLDDIGVTYHGPYPDGEVWLNPQCKAVHAGRPSGGYTAHTLVQKSTYSIVYGHSHKIEMAQRTLWEHDGPRDVVCWSTGTMARTDGIVPGEKERQNWQRGLSVYQGGVAEIAPFVAGALRFRGNSYKASGAALISAPLR